MKKLSKKLVIKAIMYVHLSPVLAVHLHHVTVRLAPSVTGIVIKFSWII